MFCSKSVNSPSFALSSLSMYLRRYTLHVAKPDIPGEQKKAARPMALEEFFPTRLASLMGVDSGSCRKTIATVRKNIATICRIVNFAFKLVTLKNAVASTLVCEHATYTNGFKCRTATNKMLFWTTYKSDGSANHFGVFLSDDDKTQQMQNLTASEHRTTAETWKLFASSRNACFIAKTRAVFCMTNATKAPTADTAGICFVSSREQR
jgi:hypothetical protein